MQSTFWNENPGGRECKIPGGKTQGTTIEELEFHELLVRNLEPSYIPIKLAHCVFTQCIQKYDVLVDYQLPAQANQFCLTLRRIDFLVGCLNFAMLHRTCSHLYRLTQQGTAEPWRQE